jgi:hypothetical protein
VKRYVYSASLLTTLTLSVALSAPGGASTNPFGTKSPSQILALASTAMRKAGSVHLAGQVSFPDVISATATLDSTEGESTQTVSGDGNRETDLVIGTSLFIKGNASDFEDSYNVKNSPLANRWVLVPSSNPNYANIFSGELLGSLAQMTVQLNSLKNLGAVTFQGKRAVAISGKLPGTSSFPNAPQTVYVSISPPYLPIGYSDRLAEQGHRGTAVAVFSKWGESVHVLRPAVFVTATTKVLP